MGEKKRVIRCLRRAGEKNTIISVRYLAIEVTDFLVVIITYYYYFFSHLYFESRPTFFGLRTISSAVHGFEG